MSKKLLFSLVSIIVMSLFTSCSTNFLCCRSTNKAATPEKPVIIAHRGASAYVPEHTLIAKVMAYAQGANYIEQDVSMTKDGHIVVMHDIFLETNTNVKDIFPNRAEKDGRYHIIDFTLNEIKQLSVHERTDGNGKPVFADRFPETDALELKVPTLEQEIILIQGLNKSTGKDKGLYIELKQPEKYKDHGHKFAQTVLAILTKHGYNSADSNCIIQCFDPELLIYMKNTLHTKLRLIQLIGGSGAMYDKMVTKGGLEKISKYAYGIGPSITRLFTNYGKSPDLELSGLSKLAHEYGLKIHPYTLRNDSLPKGLTYNEVCDYLFKKAKVDGMFTDYPDLGVEYINKNFK
jgi:glycerophosphoryl diester phosphodiesterase